MLTGCPGTPARCGVVGVLGCGGTCIRPREGHALETCIGLQEDMHYGDMHGAAGWMCISLQEGVHLGGCALGCR